MLKLIVAAASIRSYTVVSGLFGLRVWGEVLSNNIVSHFMVFDEFARPDVEHTRIFVFVNLWLCCMVDDQLLNPSDN